MSTQTNQLALNYASLRVLIRSRDQHFRATRASNHATTFFVIEDFAPLSTLGAIGPNRTEQDSITYADLLPESAQKELELPLQLRRLIWELQSGPFIELLETLSGYERLLPDPHLRNAGLFTCSDEPVQFPIGVDLDQLSFENRLSLVTVLNAESTVNFCELRLVRGIYRCEPDSIACKPGGCVIIKPDDRSVIQVKRANHEENSPQQLLVLHYYQKSN